MITKYDTMPVLPLSELKSSLARWGYVMRRSGDEIEIYPKGKRGEQSYFTDDRYDARDTAKVECKRRFERSLNNYMHLITDDQAAALVDWFYYHGPREWVNELYTAWYTGNYGYTYASSNVSSSLQRLRNTTGRKFMEEITKSR